ncbi:DNA polymerase II [Candidatus Colwellia aromaticivorans]|uniref:DNA polymerase II n=1 Tax=Candidatus Colwellia aromaticivorans TaxID=2267621 RepID=UPI000DF1AE66|nr:DNA polymerase II [Candidatus Colwellia aromaticivorans]
MQQQIENGFLLTRQAKDRGNSLQITLWLKTAFGAKKLIIDNELTVFFVEEQQVAQAEQLLQQQGIFLVKQQLLALKTFGQQSVHGFYFNTLGQFYRARDCLKSAQIKCYEDDIRPDDRYLMERFITSDIDFIGDSQTIANFDCVSFDRVNQAKCKVSAEKSVIVLSMLSLDIECSMAGELYSIGLYSKNKSANNKRSNIDEGELKRVLMIGEPQAGADSYIVWLEDEKQLLIELIKQVSLIDADIFIGWNVINFDFRLLQKRMDLHGIKFAIGRDGSAPRWRKNNNNTDQMFIEIAGRVVLDGIDLLKTATYSFPSFSLDNVANTLLGIGKKIKSTANSTPESRIAEINHNFNHDKAALAVYNLEDCRLVWLIFEKTQLLEFAQLRAQLTGLAIDRIGGSVAAFTNLYLPKLHRSGYVAPNMGDGESDLISPGGYVMDSIPGLYENILVLDFKSLYPSIIRSFKIDPMGLIEGMNEKTVETAQISDKYISGFDGACFSREKHFLPDIITSLWLERDKAKLQKNAALSQAIKIIMNSFYGVLGSTGCRFFDPRLSGSITKRSHEILKTTKSWIETKGYRVIYGDTDSIFVHVGSEQSLAQSKVLGNELQHFINKKWRQYLNEKLALDCYLEIEFETHFTKFLMPTIRGQDAVKGQKVGTKKRYVGLSEGKLIFKGLETVRSDWTQISKVFQQELFRLIFNDLPVDEYICTTVNEIKAGVHDGQLIYMKKIRRKLEDYVNTPPHIKACLIANKALMDLGRKPKYRKGSKIEYVMTLNSVMPVELSKGNLDYEHYIDKQIKPIADDVLPFIGKSFEIIVSKQINLF